MLYVCWCWNFKINLSCPIWVAYSLWGQNVCTINRLFILQKKHRSVSPKSCVTWLPHYFPLSKIKNKFLTIESFRKQHQASNRSTHYIRSSRSQMFFKIRVFKNFAILTGTHLCRSLFLIKLQAWRPETLLKRDSKAWNFVEKKLRHSCFRVKFAKFFKTPFLLNTSGGCFWLFQWRKTSVNRLYF